MKKTAWRAGLFGNVPSKNSHTLSVPPLRVTTWRGDDGRWLMVHNLPSGNDIAQLRATDWRGARRTAVRRVSAELRKMLATLARERG